MFRIFKKIIIIGLAGFFIINCDRILPDIEMKDTKPGIERALAKGYNSAKGVIGNTATKQWKKAKPKLKKYSKKTIKNTEKVVNETVRNAEKESDK